MNAFEGLSFGFSIALQAENLLACFIGVLIGTIVGVLPGIGPIGAMALLLPVTYAMTPAGALIMLALLRFNVWRINDIHTPKSSW